MAIARKPNSKPKPAMDEAAADAFIAGAAKPEAAPIAADADADADEAGQGAEPRKSPVMLRFDRALAGEGRCGGQAARDQPERVDSVHGEPRARCRRGVGRRGLSWRRLGGPGARKVSFGVGPHRWAAGSAEIHQHRHFGYVAAQLGAAHDAMLVDQVLRVAPAAHGFR